MSTVQDILARLRAKGSTLSRNRHFEVFEDPAARRALRLHLMLRKLEKDLIDYARSGAARITLQRSGPGQDAPVVLQIDHRVLKLRRRVYLNAEEISLLRQSPEVARVLLVAEQ